MNSMLYLFSDTTLFEVWYLRKTQVLEKYQKEMWLYVDVKNRNS